MTSRGMPFKEQMEPYARLKRQLRFTTHGAALRLHVKRPHHYRPVPHLDTALRARLQSALQQPDLKAHYPGQNRSSPGQKT